MTDMDLHVITTTDMIQEISSVLLPTHFHMFVLEVKVEYTIKASKYHQEWYHVAKILKFCQAQLFLYCSSYFLRDETFANVVKSP